jgi:hypothetical protein
MKILRKRAVLSGVAILNMTFFNAGCCSQRLRRNTDNSWPAAPPLADLAVSTQPQPMRRTETVTGSEVLTNRELTTSVHVLEGEVGLLQHNVKDIKDDVKDIKDDLKEIKKKLLGGEQKTPE